jgi:Fe2+ transport system protein FeoA
MTLDEATTGTRVRVVGRDIGRGMESHLNGLGIHMGDELIVVRAAPFQGPLLIEVPASGVRIAVGRGMAKSLRVEVANAG